MALAPNLSFARLLLVGAAVLGALGCRARPPRPIVDDVRIEGLREVDEEPLLEGLSTAATPLLFGFVPGVLEYSTYDPNVLARDLQRIERYLRARGYYEAKVWAARVIRGAPNHVRVEIQVQEGEPVRVARLDPGLGKLPPDVMLAVNEARQMNEGAIFDEDVYEEDRVRIQRVLEDLGYAFAQVEQRARVDIGKHAAFVEYDISLGPLARYGPVTFRGLEEIPEGPVRATLDIEPGEVYSRTDLLEAEQALVNLGIFSTVEVRPDLSRPETGVVPVTVTVRESALRAVRLGGGARFDVLRLSAHLEAGWENKNFLGGIRRFSVDARPGLTFFPTRIDRLELWTAYLPEFRTRVALRQPSFLEARTTGILSAEYNVYPLLYPLPEDVRPEDERIIGYHEIRASAGVERTFFGHRLIVAPSYNLQANYPFTYQSAEPTGLSSVQVSFPELVTVLDLRDDPLATRHGLYLSNSVQVAGYVFGGTVSDVSVRPEVRAYVPVDGAVLATRLTFGLLFPGNYGETLDPEGTTGFDIEDPAVIADQQKLLFRAFYSGGPNSNRGYPYRGVGPHGPIGFLVPTGLDCRRERLLEGQTLPPGCIRPLGGLSLWEASVEVRFPFPVDAPLFGVVFVDASDLTRNVGQIRLTVPHLSTGVGLRYLTPVGPIRLDVGYRVPGAQALGKRHLPPEEGQPGAEIFGFFPGAVHLAIGEAF
ncbi:MAG: POTRA domain-containing protein [Pseudomonadota bacterium]